MSRHKVSSATHRENPSATMTNTNNSAAPLLLVSDNVSE